MKSNNISLGSQTILNYVNDEVNAVDQFQNSWLISLVVGIPGAIQIIIGYGIEPKLMGLKLLSLTLKARELLEQINGVRWHINPFLGVQIESSWHSFPPNRICRLGGSS